MHLKTRVNLSHFSIIRECDLIDLDLPVILQPYLLLLMLKLRLNVKFLYDFIKDNLMLLLVYIRNYLRIKVVF